MSNHDHLISPAAQLMAVEIISELLIATSPHKLGEVLTNHLRELTGAKTVMVLVHHPEPALDELLHVSPPRRATLFSPAELNYFCYERSPDPLPFLPTTFPAHHPAKTLLLQAGIESFARYALQAGGEYIGLLLLLDLPQPDRLAETDQIIHILSPPIALALKNALAYRQIEQQSQILEQRVRERTAELKESRNLLQIAIASAPIPMMIHSDDDRVLQLSSGWTNLSGYTLEDIPTLSDWTERAFGERTGTSKTYIDSLFTINHSVQNGEWQVAAKDGSTRIWDFQTTPLGRDSKGRRILLSVAVDITERMRAEDALHDNQERLDFVLKGSQLGSWDWNLETNVVTRNERWAAMLGFTLDEIDFTVKQWIDFIHPDDRTEAYQSIQDHLEGRTPIHTMEYRMLAKDGGFRWILDQAQVVKRDAEGRPLRMSGTHTDMTERKQAEEEKARLEAQLQQAQKMEAVGQLAGGVAHDFNNMLGVIIGYTELVQERLEPTDPLIDDLEEVRKAGLRSVDTVRQLLTFARKQTVVPKVLDLNETVESMLKMLRRLIGENIDLAWLPGSELWPLYIDPTQIDQILANLCVNARDAIAGVGKLTVETGNILLDQAFCTGHPGFTAGEYVRISVSDSGCGIEQEHLTHIFEPFFTTKDIGEGTGLGLAMVYGAVKQNNGLINVSSALGQGTTFTIYLPRHTGETTPYLFESPSEPAVQGHETILLVEDDSTILKMTEIMLQALGYNVQAAGTPDEAIRLGTRYQGRLDLLLTDVIMPGMNGRDLAKKLRSLHPHLGVLFMSGYTADVIAHQGILDPNIHFLQKPFSRVELATKVRQALE